MFSNLQKKNHLSNLAITQLDKENLLKHNNKCDILKFNIDDLKYYTYKHDDVPSIIGDINSPLKERIIKFRLQKHILTFIFYRDKNGVSGLFYSNSDNYAYSLGTTPELARILSQDLFGLNSVIVNYKKFVYYAMDNITGKKLKIIFEIKKKIVTIQICNV